LGFVAPGTGAGGEVVVDIATVLFGSLNVTKPTGIPFGSVPVGNPASKSSTLGSPAASAGTIDASGEMSIHKTSMIEKIVLLLFIASPLIFLVVAQMSSEFKLH